MGSYVADELANRGYSVTIADINQSKYLKSNQKFIQIDINDLEKLKNIVKNASIVYNFVAIANIEDAIHDPIKSMMINTIGLIM